MLLGCLSLDALMALSCIRRERHTDANVLFARKRFGTPSPQHSLHEIVVAIAIRKLGNFQQFDSMLSFAQQAWVELDRVGSMTGTTGRGCGQLEMTTCFSFTRI